MRVPIALVGLVTVFLGAPCAAQTRASHQVRVTLPTVLRLRIDDGAPEALAAVRLAIDVEAGVALVEPDHTRLHILANTRWQLSAAFAPEDGSRSLELGFFVDGEPARSHRSSLAHVMLRGDATCGWREAIVHYLVATVPADGSYGGVITYTLSRP